MGNIFFCNFGVTCFDEFLMNFTNFFDNFFWRILFLTIESFRIGIPTIFLLSKKIIAGLFYDIYFPSICELFRLTQTLFAFNLFVWMDTFRREVWVTIQLGFIFMSLTFLGLLLPGCFSTGFCMTKGSVWYTLYISNS